MPTFPDNGEPIGLPPHCDTCGGAGEGWGMVCYGGPPIESLMTCPDCNGTGKAGYTAFWCYVLDLAAKELDSYDDSVVD